MLNRLKQLKLKDIAAFLINKNVVIIRYSVIITTIVLIAGLFPRHRFNYDYSIGQPWKYENLYAPFTLTIRKMDDSLRLEQERAIRNVIPYYTKLPNVNLAAHKNFKIELEEAYKNNENIRTVKKSDSLALSLKANQVLDSIFSKGIIALTDTHKINAIVRIRMLVENNRAVLRPVASYFLSVPEACKWANEQFSRKPISAFDDIWLQSLCNVLNENILFDTTTTNKAQFNELNSLSETAGMVQANQLIIAQGALVTTDTYRTLESLKKIYNTSAETTGWHKYSNDIGYLLITTIVIGIFLLFIKLFHSNELLNLRNLLFILGTITFFLYIVKTVVEFQDVASNGMASYILPFCIVPIVISNFFGSRLANYVHLVVIFLTGFIVPLGYEYLFLQFMAGLLAVLVNEKTHYWSQFFVSVGLILICYCLSYLVINLMQGNGLENIKYNTFAWFLINALLTLLAYPFIPLYEKIFGFVSSITLAELSDLNRPLIKRIYEKAPGTFWHSIQVANLAEAACSEIKANAMLAKVGALYHDIGKMKNPAYFIENQKTEINPHDELMPTESAKIIKEHVTHGIELAKQEGLPNVIIDFIRTHHGNTRIELFYQRQLKEHPDTRLEETLFRYPGPLPYSKETAIVMLADSIEAASRSLKNPTEEDINRLVDNIVEHKIKQQQFAFCDISFKDITAVKTVFKKQLRSIYHVRISYPDVVS